MAKIRKAVFRNGMVMLSLLAVIVLSGSVAQAQLECGARVSMPETARAEGVTEVVGTIELRCAPKDLDPDTVFGPQTATVPAMLEVAIQLNTSITNSSDSDGNVEVVAEDNNLGFTVGGISLTGRVLNQTTPGADIADTVFGDGEVSADGDMIMWEIATDTTGTGATDPLNLSGTDDGFSLMIAGVRADASAVGDGENITVNVLVDGDAINSTPIKVADVTTGIDLTVTMASGLQCIVPMVKDDDGEDMYTAVATIKFVEGFASAFTDDHSLVLNLRGIPENVTVMASLAGTGIANDPMVDENAQPVLQGDLAPVTLADSGRDSDGIVVLSAGSGQVIYTFDDEIEGDTALEGTDPLDPKEWNTVTLTFKWESGANPSGIGTGSVAVSYYPVGGDKTPRYTAGETNEVIEVGDCVTSLLFPFVTNIYGYETGVAITNTSPSAGACMLSFSGTDAPADDMEIMVAANSVTTFGVASMAPGFQGFIDAECKFRNGKGFAFISNGFDSMGGPTAAHGYLVADEIVSSD